MESEALTLEIAQELAATSVAALKPGDVLAVRMPLSMNARELHQAALYGQKIEAETGVKVAFIPGDEFAHVTINITVNMAGATPDKLAGEIRREIAEQARTARGDALLRLARGLALGKSREGPARNGRRVLIRDRPPRASLIA